MPSISSYISSHNITTLNKSNTTNEPQRTCNCNTVDSCPLNGKCLVPACIYQGTINVTNDEQRKYIGLSEPVIKGRVTDHMTSCTYIKYRTKSKLSQEYWTLLKSGHPINKNEDIKFEILKKSVPYRAGSKKCNLCLWEKLIIMKNEESVINKRDEFVSKCRHTNKFMLSNFKTTKKKSRMGTN